VLKNCHCEERSDEAIFMTMGLLRFARNDRYTQIQCLQTTMLKSPLIGGFLINLRGVSSVVCLILVDHAGFGLMGTYEHLAAPDQIDEEIVDQIVRATVTAFQICISLDLE